MIITNLKARVKRRKTLVQLRGRRGRSWREKKERRKKDRREVRRGRERERERFLMREETRIIYKKIYHFVATIDCQGW